MNKNKIFFVFVLIALLLAACTTPEQPKEELATTLPDEMLDTIWEWTEIVVKDPNEWSSPIADPPNYTVFFNSDGFSDVEADCNFVQGQYEVAGESLDFSVGAPTFTICGPETASCQYLVYMSQVDSYRLEDGKLILPFGDGTGELIFSAVGAAGSGPPSSGGDENGNGSEPSGPDEPDGPGGPINPPGDDGNKKVVVCHKANGKNPITLEVSKNALNAHLAHGDTEGPCQ